MSQLILVDKADFEKIIAKTNRIDIILDDYKQKIPLGVWYILNDLNAERAELFAKYFGNWDELT